MSETRCKWVASDRPRVLAGRHEVDCPDEACRGCQPCPMDHCRVCGVEHSSGACGGCLTEVRGNLKAIATMCRALPAEVEHRGVEGEAMNLLGPSTDSEQWHHRKVSTLAGRIVPLDCEARDIDDVQAWLERAEGELHPLWVTGTWASVYADALEHDLEGERITVIDAVEYLDRHLTEAAEYPWTPFEDFARDLRRCVAHMERVLHDGEQVDEGVPCLKCERRLTRVWGYGNKPDGWECKRCREFSTEGQYRFAVTQDYIRSADWLPAELMTERAGVKASTVRSWARKQDEGPPLVRSKLHSGRTVYAVADVERERDTRGVPCA